MTRPNAKASSERIGFVKARNQKVKLRNRRRDLPNTDFSPSKQTWKLLSQQVRGMLLTAFFLAIMIITLVVYEKRGTTGRSGRLVFNTITTGLGLGLGLNFFEVFKDMAKVVRWRILGHEFTVREVDLVMGAESLIKTLQLGFESFRKPLILTSCLLWLLLNIIAQASVAIMPLFYTLDKGSDSSSITFTDDTVNVTKLDCYRRNNESTCPALDVVVPSISHSDSQINSAPQYCIYFRNNVTIGEYALRFTESNPDDFSNNYPNLGAGRIVKVTAQGCTAHRPQGPTIIDSGLDGEKDEWEWRFDNATAKNLSLTVPRTVSADNATTYMWNGTALPARTGVESCGGRCLIVYALRNSIRDGQREGTIFQCQILVSAVSNVTDPAHELSDNMARTAAAAISQSGRWRSPDWGRDFRQWQLYQLGSYWSLNIDDSPDQAGAKMSEFAVSSLGVLTRRNPTTGVWGTKPSLGYQLKVTWLWIIMLAGGIAVVHILLVTFMLWIARPVAVGDNSYLVAAHLLRGLVEGLPEGYESRLWDEKGIAREIEAEIDRTGEVESGEEMKGLLRPAPPQYHSDSDL